MLGGMFINYDLWDYITTVLDVAIVAFVVYKLLFLVRGTRAVQLIKGIVVLLVVAVISNILELTTIQWLLSQIWSVFFVMLVVVFQPEIRRALEHIGLKSFFPKASGESSFDTDDLENQIVRACLAESKTKTGMLLVLERSVGLNEYINNGIQLDARVSEQMLINIFVPNTPLHDGAAVIRGDRIVAAACFLPLTDNPYLSSELGTRHRAAIGMSEVSDALVLVVSEETGRISAAQNGKLMKNLDESSLRRLLVEAAYSSSDNEKRSSHFWNRRSR
ncbi:MAG: diadenylate cyclase CdaA [Bacillota bacterium]|jgi:diadenylate cyclase